MKVLIDRYQPETAELTPSEYEIDDAVTGGMTVMDLLAYISKNIDPSLGYYSHSACNHGVCGRCVLRVNGKPALACVTRVRDYDRLELAPANMDRAVRDLVIRT